MFERSNIFKQTQTFSKRIVWTVIIDKDCVAVWRTSTVENENHRAKVAYLRRLGGSIEEQPFYTAEMTEQIN